MSLGNTYAPHVQWAPETPVPMRKFWSEGDQHCFIEVEGMFQLRFLVYVGIRGDHEVKCTVCSFVSLYEVDGRIPRYLALPASRREAEEWVFENVEELQHRTSPEHVLRCLVQAWQLAPLELTRGTKITHSMRKAEVLEE